MRKEFGFEGTIVSDWDSTYDGIGAANNGLDLEMPSPKFMNKETLMPAIQSGKARLGVANRFREASQYFVGTAWF